MNIAPLKNTTNSPTHHESLPWEGDCWKKPWEYRVTAVVPHIDAPDELEIVVKLLELQTEKPFVIIVDSGSTIENLAKVEKLRSESVEVHSLRLNGVQHPSDFVAMAMDLAWGACRTEYLFATHADCFLRRQDFIETYLPHCGPDSPLVGYRLTERQFDGWETMLGHTATFYHLPTCDRIGVTWSLRRLATMFGLENHKPHPDRPNWPDTEYLPHYVAVAAGFKPVVIGSEENFKRNVDDNIDHVRSISGGRLYSPDYLVKAQQWMDLALVEAKERVVAWGGSLGSPEPKVVQAQSIKSPTWDQKALTELRKLPKFTKVVQTR